MALPMDDPAIRTAEYAYLTTTGRVTGTTHTVELWFVTDDNTVWFLSDSDPDWQRNARAYPAVSVRIGEWTWPAAAHLESPTEMSRAGLTARIAMVEKYQPGYAGDLNAWARDATALGARVAPPDRAATREPT